MGPREPGCGLRGLVTTGPWGPVKSTKVGRGPTWALMRPWFIGAWGPTEP